MFPKYSPLLTAKAGKDVADKGGHGVSITLCLPRFPWCGHGLGALLLRDGGDEVGCFVMRHMNVPTKRKCM